MLSYTFSVSIVYNYVLHFYVYKDISLVYSHGLTTQKLLPTCSPVHDQLAVSLAYIQVSIHSYIHVTHNPVHAM